MELKFALLAASAGIVFCVGCGHLALTYVGPKLRPRNPQVEPLMRDTHLVITREISMWQAWIGFNVTHSLFLMLFGVVYLYLALALPEVLRSSRFLLSLGLGTLLSLNVLAKTYFFSVPQRFVLLATILYAAGLVLLR